MKTTSKIILILLLATIASQAMAQKKMLFKARDFTAENLFSGNIEGPAFDRNGILYVVNYMHDGTIGIVNPDGTCKLFVELPEGSIANSIKFNKKGDMLLPDFTKHNILKVNMKTREVSVFCHDSRMFSPNDITLNSRGQIFASDPDWQKNCGQLWRIDPDGTDVLLEQNMGTTNGIVLTPDEKFLYVNESIQRKIWKYKVDDAGQLSDKTLFASFDDYGLDGMKCDVKGNLYVTRWGKGTVVVFSPSGKQIREIYLKGKSCSNLVFGGTRNKTVYVTLQDRKCMEKFENNIPGN